MSAALTALIDKQDTFEIVRDEIAAILAVEIAEQQTLATAAAEDPASWKLRIFSERSNPWEQFRDDPTDISPIVNVWYDSSSFTGGDVVERQTATGVFNIDCYGYGLAQDDGNGGHLPGDREAAFAVQRALRLVRNILMSAAYVYLGLQGTVWKRWPQSVTVFQPELDKTPVPQIVGARLALQVDFSEFSPQIDPEDLELVAVEVRRTEDGEIVLEANYDY